MKAAETVQLGSTAIHLTRLGLGSAALGNLYQEVEEGEAQAVVARAHDVGIRLFDTAPLYGYGLAERRLGQVLSEKPRDSFVLATKVGRLLRSGLPPDATQFHQGEAFYKGTPAVSPVFDFSYEGVMRSVEESLERLSLERIDILHIHDPDDHHDAALQGAYRALATLRSEGVIGAVGAGMNQAEALVRFATEADFDCFLLAGRYTLLDQSAFRELLPMSSAKGISIIIGGVYNSGLLADPSPGARFNYVPAADELVLLARRLDEVCRRHGVPLKAAALRFPFGHPSVAAVLSGCRSVAELEENIRMFEVDVPADLWEELKSEGLLPEEIPTP